MVKMAAALKVKEEGSPLERRQWLAQWATKQPQASIDTAREALQQHFGMAIGTDRISEILKEARRRFEVDQHGAGKRPAMPDVPDVSTPSGPQSTPSALVAAVGALRASGLTPKAFLVGADGSVRIEV